MIMLIIKKQMILDEFLIIFFLFLKYEISTFVGFDISHVSLSMSCDKLHDHLLIFTMYVCHTIFSKDHEYINMLMKRGVNLSHRRRGANFDKDSRFKSKICIKIVYHDVCGSFISTIQTTVRLPEFNFYLNMLM